MNGSTKHSRRCVEALLVGLSTLALWPEALAQNRSPAAVVSLREKALAGPLAGAEEILFCTRLRYDDPHWYANIGYYCQDETQKAYPGNGKPDSSRLYKLNVRTGQTTALFDAQGGTVRDPQVHYDAGRIVFSYRQAGTDYFHLHEINTDGGGLCQLTSGDFDDYEPAYLPDGGIAFVSTRCRRWVNCWKTQVGVIYRCDADGRNIRLISSNTEHDNTPWMLPDGRMLYTRWEYVDRSQVEYHHLWAMNPDGTGQAVFFGNLHSFTVMIDAKPILGTGRVIASFSPGHGVNEHAGIATVLSEESGPDNRAVARPLHQGPLTRDPYALAEDLFLMARGRELVLMDLNGRQEVLHVGQGDAEVHEPRPIQSRPRERIIPTRVHPAEPTGRMILSDVYNCRNLPGVKRGEIRKLLVLESLPKQVNFSGGPDLVSWLGTFTLERVVGTVPVEEDGSAYFEAPANRQLFFVALDEKDLSVKRMQSFTTVMPGEVLGCVGCHENRARAPENKPVGKVLALQRPPSPIEPFAGLPDVLDFNRDIQPILDRHCVGCHSCEKPEGGVILAGDLGPHWSHSYFSLLAHRQVADGRNGLGNQPPRTIGSAASPLLAKGDGRHYEARLSASEWRTLWLWIESGAAYAGTYAALRNEGEQILPEGAVAMVFFEQHAVLARRCGQCHQLGGKHEEGQKPLPFNYEVRRRNRQLAQRPTGDWERIVLENDAMARYSTSILLNYTRPELSPLLLGPLAKNAGGYERCGAVFQDRTDPDYQRLLTAIQKGKALLDGRPRFGTAGFKPNPQYVREMKRFGILPASFDLAQQSLDVFQADQEYWKLSWYQPAR